tara:strand:+ start:40 stop:324 length:285 start_codon:yes stop_codon:yes gene_type:complete
MLTQNRNDLLCFELQVSTLIHFCNNYERLSINLKGFKELFIDLTGQSSSCKRQLPDVLDLEKGLLFCCKSIILKMLGGNNHGDNFPIHCCHKSG